MDDKQMTELRRAVAAARAAGDGDSNDAEIQAWQEVGDLIEADQPGDVTVTSSDDTVEPYRLEPDDEEITLAMLAEPDRAPTIEGDQLSENFGAAERAAQVLVHSEPGGRDDSEVMKDLLSDMFHLCDLLGLDMDELVNSAQRNYAAEIRGEN